MTLMLNLRGSGMLAFLARAIVALKVPAVHRCRTRTSGFITVIGRVQGGRIRTSTGQPHTKARRYG
jgi:hypothetical protein